MSTAYPEPSVTELAPNLWVVQCHLHGAGMHIRLRMTVIRLAGGGLWLHSPVPLDERLGLAIDQLGSVEHVVAPSRFHHLFAPAAKQRYPRATLWAAPTLPEKRRDVTFDAVLTGDMGTWERSLETLPAGGNPFFSEVLFIHIPSRSLICSDFLFNVTEEPEWRTRTLYRALGVWQRFGQSRVWRWATRDRGAATETARLILDRNVERVIMAHGEILEDQVQERLHEALDWLEARR